MDTWVSNILAEYINAYGIALPMKTIGAENLLESQQEQIARAFNARAYQHYGLSEAVANFSEDNEHEMYVDEDFAATEFYVRMQVDYMK